MPFQFEPTQALIDTPGRVLRLKEMQQQYAAEQLRQYMLQQRMQQDQQVQRLYNMPGMVEGNLLTDRGLASLRQISAPLADEKFAERVKILNDQSQIRKRAVEEDEKLQQQSTDKIDEMMGGASMVYHRTPGPPEVKQAALRKFVNDSMRKYEEDGTASKYRWTTQFKQGLRNMDSIDNIDAILLGHKQKDVVERGEESEASRVESGTDTAKVPLGDLGKLEAVPDTQSQPSARSTDTRSGATVQGGPEGQAIETSALPDQTKTAEQEAATAEMGPTIGRMEEQKVTATARPDTPDGLRDQAKASEKQAEALRKLGTKVGSTRAKEFDAKADRLRNAAVALEGRIQAETRLEMQAKRAESTQKPLEDDAVAFVVNQYLSGNPNAIAGLARNQVAKAQILNAIPIMAAKRGMSPQAVNAAILRFQGMGQQERTLGGRIANMAVAVNEMKNFIPLAEKASDAVPRSNFVPMNKLMQMSRNQWSAPQAAFVAANRSLINAFAQVASRGAPTVHNTEEAENMLNTAQTADQYKKVLRQLWAEAQGAQKATFQSQEEAQSQAMGQGFKEQPYPGDAGKTAPRGKTPTTYQDADKEKRYQEWKKQHGYE